MCIRDSIGIALVLMFIVMAAVFESLLFPLAIMSCVLFSVFGVYWLFWLTGTAFTIMAIICILVLMGAVSYTHLRAHETVLDIVCRLLLDKKTHPVYTYQCDLNSSQP